MLRVIVDNPEENFSSWGEGDVFRSKATGFQRLALTREFVSILDQGENAISRLPINLDASSSIYQHASALMLDADMASKVNEIVAGKYDHKGESVVYGDTDSVYLSLIHI